MNVLIQHLSFGRSFVKLLKKYFYWKIVIFEFVRKKWYVFCNYLDIAALSLFTVFILLYEPWCPQHWSKLVGTIRQRRKKDKKEEKLRKCNWGSFHTIHIICKCSCIYFNGAAAGVFFLFCGLRCNIGFINRDKWGSKFRNVKHIWQLPTKNTAEKWQTHYLVGWSLKLSVSGYKTMNFSFFFSLFCVKHCFIEMHIIGLIGIWLV